MFWGQICVIQEDALSADRILNYQTAGAGQPLLLIHGLGVSFNIWNALVPLLEKSFFLVMIELPGIGQSPLPDGEDCYTAAAISAIESVRHKLEIPKWSVLGYSIGVGIALAYAAAHPESTEATVLLCPPLLRRWRWRILHSLLWVDRRWSRFGDWLLSGWRLYRLVGMIGFNSHFQPLTRAWTDEISSQPPEILKASLVEYPSARQVLGPTRQRTLLICGRRDVTSAPLPRKHAGMVTFPGNHSGPVQRPEAIAALITEFLLPNSCQSTSSA